MLAAHPSCFLMTETPPHLPSSAANRPEPPSWKSTSTSVRTKIRPVRVLSLLDKRDFKFTRNYLNAIILKTHAMQLAKTAKFVHWTIHNATKHPSHMAESSSMQVAKHARS